MIKLGNIHLVTGYAGHQHITSADQAVFNALTFGSGQYVLANGNQFAASIVTNNTINVLDGDILMQGRHIRLNEATSVDLTIENGAQGYYRNDLIVARYTKDENTGIEDANLVVIKGTAAESDPADPAYTSGDLVKDNATLNDMPLYRVQLDGLNISALVPLFDAVEIGLISHARRHASGGSDEITPAMIGAASAEEHTVKHYTTLSALNLSDSDFDPTDATANFEKIHNALTTDAEVWFTYAGTTNFAKSVHAKLYDDLGITTTSYVDMRIQRNTSAMSEIRIVLQYYSSSATKQLCEREYSCILRHFTSSADYLSKFCVTRDPDGFVSKVGDTMTDNLLIEKDKGYVAVKHVSDGSGVAYGNSGHNARILLQDSYGNTTKGRIFYMHDSTAKSDINEALQLVDVVNSQLKVYNVLHTGNIDSLYPAANIVTGSYVGTGTYGEDNKNSVVLPEEPALFVVGRENHSIAGDSVAIRVKGSTILARVGVTDNSSSAACKANWNESTSALEWSNEDATKQMNADGYTFFYVAIY